MTENFWSLETMSEQQKVTEDMIEVGLKIFAEYGLVDGYVEADKLVLAQVFRAMANRQSAPRDCAT